MKKNIPVYFAYHEPYADYPEKVRCLGKITLDDANKLMDAIENHTPNGRGCYDALRAEMTRVATRKGDDFAKGYTQINLFHMFYRYDIIPATRYKPCMCETNPQFPKKEKTMICRCARELRSGNCKDPFVRNTIGTILYPEIYAPQKTK